MDNYFNALQLDEFEISSNNTLNNFALSYENAAKESVLLKKKD